MGRGEGRGEGKGDDDDEGKSGGGVRELDQVCRESSSDFEGSSNDIDDVKGLKIGEIAIVLRSDGSWRYAKVDEKNFGSDANVESKSDDFNNAKTMEFQVGQGEDDYKLFVEEEFNKIRVLDCGGGGHK